MSPSAQNLRSSRLSGLAVLLAAALGVFIAFATPSAGAPPAPPPHPLDPLSAAELETAFGVIEASNKFPEGAFFPIVTLNEPPKSEVLAWSPGESFRREAFANVYDRENNRLYEAVVNLRTEKLASWVQRPGDQPAIFATEYEDGDAAVREDPRWKEAMRDRGVNPDDVYLDLWAPGDVDLPGVPPNTRLTRAISFFRGDLPNPYDRPIEGVIAYVNMNTLEVIEVTDTGIRPVNKTITGNADSVRTGLRPLNVVQPQGPSFKITGNAVEWQGWHFRVGFVPREGLVLHQIGYEQDGVLRPVIYRIALNEIYVPYAIPDANWVWRAALDIGEYNTGQFSEELLKKVDVPTNAVFFDEVTPSDVGSGGDPAAIELPNSVAIYERDAGSLWDRTDPTTFERDARFSRELVVTNSYPIGNYTYTIDYVFRQDGGMDVVAGSTGTTLNRGVNSVAEGDEFGASVAPKIAAPMHQHFFNFRIDFDVDGTKNRLVEENIQSVSSSFGNAFDVFETVRATEQFRDVNPATDRRWVVESTTNHNALGHHTAYELEPASTTHAYSRPDFPPLEQAQFAQHFFWLTAFKDGERYAAGDYPNQGEAGEGLPKYVSEHANVDGRDLVVWYTAGFTHPTRIEDYPVMPTNKIGFSIEPHGFFDENPALDVP